jgi:lipopolysaccharide/colanic/teichoic acid biosynthesis glycosyltransferase
MHRVSQFKKYAYLLFDASCLTGALAAALYLRHGLPLIQEGTNTDLVLLLLTTFAVALLVLPLLRTHLTMWRYTGGSEIRDVILAVSAVVVLSNAVLFLTSRLEMMPRSVPPLHLTLALVAMLGSRMLARYLLVPRNAVALTSASQHVLVIGANSTAELYLQIARRVLHQAVRVEGFIDSNRELTNRRFHQHKILGTVQDIPKLIEKFLVHGIAISQVVLATRLGDLTAEDRKLLLQLKRSGTVTLIHFAKQMLPPKTPTTFPTAAPATSGSTLHTGIYPSLKRLSDILFSAALLLLLSPLMLLTALLVALDVGFPLLFWQKRPGLHGRPFHLYKFRTMRSGSRRLDEDRQSHKTSDKDRTSTIGYWLRRLRLDELPQLVQILTGTMSFVGPRPLLPEDQPTAGHIRLSVRPGVTGWAQIHGGDALSPEQKLVLDSWYIEHMSWWLDMRILVRTVLVLLKIDHPRPHAPLAATPTAPAKSYEPIQR